MQVLVHGVQWQSGAISVRLGSALRLCEQQLGVEVGPFLQLDESAIEEVSHLRGSKGATWSQEGQRRLPCAIGAPRMQTTPLVLAKRQSETHWSRRLVANDQGHWSSPLAGSLLHNNDKHNNVYSYWIFSKEHCCSPPNKRPESTDVPKQNERE